MGSVRSKVARGTQQLEKRAVNRASENKSKVVFPKSTSNVNQKPVISNDELHMKNQNLHERLKGLRAKAVTMKMDDIIADLPGDRVSPAQSQRKMPQVREKVDPSAYVNHPPNKIPPGRLTEEQLALLFALYQERSMTIAELAERFKLDVEMTQDLVQHFGLFSKLYRPTLQHKALEGGGILE